MTDRITLHRLAPETIGVLTNVAEDVFDDAIDGQRLAACLESRDSLIVVALHGDLVVGQVTAYVHRHPDQPSDVYVDNLGVAPKFQRRGIARSLVREVFAWAKAQGCRQAWIVTDTANDAARSLYEKLGAEAEPVAMFSYDLAAPLLADRSPA